MDFNWTPHFASFWIFPLLCLLFMGVMMFACRGMAHRFGHGGRGRNGGKTAREVLDRRYASGEIGKEEHDAIRRDLDA